MANNEINRVPELIPQDIANISADFVLFLQKYYEFLNQDGMPSDNVSRALHRRNLDQSIDNYLDVLYLEFGYGFVFNRDANKANILSNLPQIYSGKGSLDSVKVLFRIIFGEEVSIRLPKEVILQPSHGNWLSEYSVMAVVQEGNPFDMIGKFVEVKTTFADTPTQTFDVEIKRVELRDPADGVYQIYTSRFFSGFFAADSEITYLDVKLKLIRSMSNTIKDGIEEVGSGFRIGETYEVKAYDRGNAYNDVIGIPSKLSRRTPSQSLYRSIDVENVDVDVRTDGTITEVSTKETDRGTIRTTTIIRGNKKTIREELPDGTVKESSEVIDGFPAPNLQVDWDAIKEAMVELDTFQFGGDDVLIYGLLNEINPNTGKKYADATAGGLINWWDFYYFYRLYRGYSTRTGYAQDFYDEWNSRYPNNPLSPSFAVALIVLRFNTAASQEAQGDAALIQEMIDHINQKIEISGRLFGDIDNDGTIDSSDLIYITEYVDPVTRDLMNTDAKDYIEDVIFPLPESIQLPEEDGGYGKTLDEALEYLIIAFASNYQQAVRNQLHDFLLQEDPDYPGFVRADINNDGKVDLEDVKILLRRASGIPVDSGSIGKINYPYLVGGYSDVNPVIDDPHGKDGTIRTNIQDGVLTTLDIRNPGLGLTAAFVKIYDPTRYTYVWRRYRRKVAGAYSDSIARLNLVDGKIDDIDMTRIGTKYDIDSTEVSIYAYRGNARIYPVFSGGQIVDFNISYGGTGYQNLSTISLIGADGTGFDGDVVVHDGVITGFDLATGGSGYSNDVTVTVNSNTGLDAEIEAIVEDGVITGFNIINPGHLYNFIEASDTVTITDNAGTPTEEANVTRVNTIDGVIHDITIYDQGGSASPSSGGTYLDYTAARVSINRVTQEPELIPIIQDGVIYNINVVNSGEGYKEETATINLNADRTDPQISYSLDSSGSIVQFSVEFADGYADNATVTITEDGHTGSDAQINLRIVDGKITDSYIIDSGSGYSNPSFEIGPRKDADLSIDIGTDYLTWIDEVIVEPLIGSIYNPLLLSGPGKGGVVRVQEVDGNGGIRKLKFQEFGYNYPDYFTTFIEPNNPGGTVATIGFKSEVVGVTSPSYVDRKGFLSDIIKLQDNNFYQQFSYVIETGVAFEVFEDIVKKSVHPAGMKVFGEQTITDFFEIEVSIDEAYAAFNNRLFLDLTDIPQKDNDDWHLIKDLPRVEDPTDSTVITSLQEVYHLEKPKYDVTDVQSNTDDVWYFEKDLTVDDYHEIQIAEALKETYHLYKDSDSTKDFPVADNLKETWHLYKPLYDITTNEDDEVYSFIKVLFEESQAVSQKETYHLEKPKTDRTLNTDNDDYHLFKPKTDESIATDSYPFYDFIKSNLDTVVTSEYLPRDIIKGEIPDVAQTDDSSIKFALGINIYELYSDPKIANENHFVRPTDLPVNHVFKYPTDMVRVEDDTALVGVDDDNILAINKTVNTPATAVATGGFVHRSLYAYDYFATPEDYSFTDTNYTFTN